MPKFDNIWYRYQCFVAIILMSSNTKTLLFYLPSSLEIFYLSIAGLFECAEHWSGIAIMIIIVIIFGVIFFVMITHGLIGIIIYFWIFIILLFAYSCIVFCAGKKRLYFYKTFGLIIITFLIIILGLSTINIYSGINYFDSLIYVLT